MTNQSGVQSVNPMAFLTPCELDDPALGFDRSFDGLSGTCGQPQASIRHPDGVRHDATAANIRLTAEFVNHMRRRYRDRMTDPTKTWRFGLMGAMLAAMLLAPAAMGADLPDGFDPKRHMTVDEVRPGMRGYGLTVFSGVEIEPFDVEVVSVMHGFMPGKSLVWIRCPDQRMQKLGVVKGMSGSPVFLWPVGDKAIKDGGLRTPGVGGRMIGAYAYGPNWSKDSLAGVQPIEQMLRAAERTPPESADDGAAARTPSPTAHAAHGRTVATALHAAQTQASDGRYTWRLQALADLLKVDAAPAARSAPADEPEADRFGQTLPLPLSVGSAEQARWLAPFVRPMHLQAVAPQGAIMPASPPSWIDPDAVSLQPGGVLSIPLISGAMDLGASGTITEVLDDGRVLAFGHGMYGLGPVALPMGTGYVHFVMPTVVETAKLSGTLRTLGAVVYDENVGIVGRIGASYPTARSTAHVRWHDTDRTDTYEYELAHFPPLVPALAGYGPAIAMITDRDLPLYNTVEMASVMRFADGRQLRLREVMPNAMAGIVMYMIAGMIGMCTENQFDPVDFVGIETTIDIQDEARVANIIGARLEQAEVAPGQPIVAHLKIKPFRKDPISYRVAMTLPDDLPEGTYQWVIGGPQTGYQENLMLRPHLMHTTNVVELFEAVQYMLDIESDGLYAVLHLLPSGNVAIGRTELPRLPSSRQALMTTEHTVRTYAYSDSQQLVRKMPFVVEGAASFQIHVSGRPGDEQ